MTTLLYDFFTYLEVAVRESRGLGERIFCLIVRPQKVQCQNGTRQSPEPAASSGPPMRLGRAQTRPSSTAFPRPSAGAGLDVDQPGQGLHHDELPALVMLPLYAMPQLCHSTSPSFLSLCGITTQS